MRLSSPASVTSKTLIVYFLPGRSSFMFTEVVVRGRSVKKNILLMHWKQPNKGIFTSEKSRGLSWWTKLNFHVCICVYLHLPSTMGCPVPWPCSVSSYSTLKPETVSEAETQEMTKLLEVISVTDSEMSTTGGGCVVSPCDVATTGETEMENERVGFLLPLRSELAAADQDNLNKGFYVSVRNSY